MAGGLLNPLHLMIVLAVALIVLGPKRLPQAGRGLGEALRGFKDALGSDDHSDRKSTPVLPGSRDDTTAPTAPDTAARSSDAYPRTHGHAEGPLDR